MKKLIALILFLVCTIIPVIAIVLYEATRTSDLTAEILARAPERGNFLPRKLTFSVGQKVKLRVRNIDTVTHGFTIPDLGIKVGDIKAGRQAIVRFTPEKAGRYDFYCTAWCSDHHLQMRGVIEVVEK